MRPLTLEVEGLASIRERQTVDFRQMDTLFAIIGPTGAGKTTTLDAISLALFGQLPRMDRSFRDFMSLGLNRTKVAFEFQVGDGHYRVVRTFARKGNQEASIERIRLDGSAYPLVDDGGVSSVSKRVEEILGLDYETFSRVILLPQGDFAEMLQGGAKERRAILTRLLGVGRFERAGSLARERAKDLENKSRVLKDLVDKEYGKVTPERHRETVEKADALGASIHEIELVLDTVRAASGTLQDLERQGVKAATAVKKLGDIAQRQSALRGQWEALAPTLAAAEETRAVAQTAVTATSAVLQETQREAESLKTAAGSEQELRTLVRDTEDLARAEGDLAALAVRLTDVGARLVAARVRHENTQQRANSAQAADVATHATLEAARDALREAQTALTLALGKVAAVDALGRATECVAVATSEITVAQVRVDEAKAKVDAAVHAREDALREQHVAALAEHLHAGDDCPVCARPLEVPPSVRNPDVDAATLALEAARSALEPLALQLTARHRALADATSRRDRAAETLDGFHAAMDVPAAEKALEAARAHLDDSLGRADAVIRERQEAFTAVSAAERELGQAMSAESGLTEQAATLEGQRDTLGLRIDASVGVGRRATAQAWATEHLEHWTALALRTAGAQAAHTAAQKQLLDLIEKAAEHQNSKHAIERETGTLWERLASALDHEAGPAETDSVGVQLEAMSEALDAARSKIGAERDAVAEQYKAVRANIRTALARIGASGQGDAVAAVEQLLGARRDERTRLAAQAERLTEQLTRRFDLIREAVDVGSQAERYKQLGGELKGDRFVKYVLDESFQELALGASDELHLLSDGKYSLRALGDAFVVVDHANADEERSVSTLSGGESFMASLALAMALAKGIRDLAGDVAGARLESVFIDEGFGTLDPATLDTVVDGLERLQATGRTIGVITHVAELAERIPSGLEIVPGANGSSIRNRQEAQA